MEKDTNDRHGNVIPGHWRRDPRPLAQAAQRSDAQDHDELETLASIARSTIADLEHYDEPEAAARLQDASRRFAAFSEQLRGAPNHALGSVNRLARRHPLLLAGGCVAVGYALMRVLAKRRESRRNDEGGING